MQNPLLMDSKSLVIQRGPSHFVTVCDATNNTAARIDRNELYIDIAIQPVKAVEFIYITTRIKILWVPTA